MNTVNKLMFLWEPDAQRARDCTVTPTTSYGLLSQLIREWHSTLPISPPGMRVGFLICSPNQVPIGAAMWGRPVARLEDQGATLELTRLAHSLAAPYNLGSWALARMRKWIRENMPEIRRVISYQNADVHDGTIYKADNWEQVYEVWDSKSTWTNREGRVGTEVRHRIKWERIP